RYPLLLWHLGRKALRVVLIVGGGIVPGPGRDVARQVGLEVHVGRRHRRLDQVGMAEHLALAGVGQDDELVAQVPANGPGLRHHRDRLQAHAGEGAQVGHEHAVVGVPRRLRGEVEGVGVLHQELAASHHTEARPDLVAELPLDMVKKPRQVAVGSGRPAEDLGDQLLVGWAIEHLALVPVLEAEHLRPVGVVAPALAPQLGLLERGHEQLDGAGAVLLLLHDLLDLLEHLEAQRQPRVDAGAGLADHAGAQHELVRGDFRLARNLAQHWQEVLGQAHWDPVARPGDARWPSLELWWAPQWRGATRPSWRRRGSYPVRGWVATMDGRGFPRIASRVSRSPGLPTGCAQGEYTHVASRSRTAAASWVSFTKVTEGRSSANERSWGEKRQQ